MHVRHPRCSGDLQIAILHVHRPSGWKHNSPHPLQKQPQLSPIATTMLAVFSLLEAGQIPTEGHCTPCNCNNVALWWTVIVCNQRVVLRWNAEWPFTYISSNSRIHVAKQDTKHIQLGDVDKRCTSLKKTVLQRLRLNITMSCKGQNGWAWRRPCC